MNGDDTILRPLGTKEEDRKEDEVVASSEDRILLFARPLDAFAVFVIIALTEVKNIIYMCHAQHALKLYRYFCTCVVCFFGESRKLSFDSEL